MRHWYDKMCCFPLIQKMSLIFIFLSFFSALGVSPQNMPFTLDELINISLRLKEVSLGLVELAFPESRPSVREDYRTAVTTLHEHPVVSPTAKDTQMWAHLFKVFSRFLCRF